MRTHFFLFIRSSLHSFVSCVYLVAHGLNGSLFVTKDVKNTNQDNMFCFLWKLACVCRLFTFCLLTRLTLSLSLSVHIPRRTRKVFGVHFFFGTKFHKTILCVRNPVRLRVFGAVNIYLRFFSSFDLSLLLALELWECAPCCFAAAAAAVTAHVRI